MSRLLRSLLGLEISIGLLFAGFFGYIGAGHENWPQLAAVLLPVVLCAAFYFRWPAAYSALATYSGVMVLCGVLYIFLRFSLPSTPEISASALGILLESAICACILLELLKKSTKDWYRRVN